MRFQRIYVLIGFLLLALKTNATTPPSTSLCSSYRTSCPATIGNFVQRQGSFDISSSSPVYFYLTLPTVADDLYLSLTLYYGEAAVYVAVGREPTANNFDFTFVGGGMRSMIPKEFVASHGGISANILIRPIVPILFRAMVATIATVPQLSLGYPMQFKLDQAVEFGDSKSFQFVPAATTTSIDVIVTTLSGSGVAFIVSGPANVTDSTTNDVSTTRVWKSFGDDGEDSFNDNGMVSIHPASWERSGLFTITVWLSSGNNASDCVIAAVDVTNSDSAYQLISGTPSNDMVTTGQEKYFILQVPTSRLSDVVININALSGDPDIYVNPSNRGFYHRASITTDHPDLVAVWSSTQPGATADGLSIAHTDDNFSRANGKFLISVYGFEGSQFTIVASQVSGVSTLMEGQALTGSAAYGQYRYYRYLDSYPGLDIEIDLHPTSGDADLFVSCFLNPTGDDAGIPSRSHYNFSSVRYMEDTLLIPAGDSRRCVDGIYFIAVIGFSYYTTVSYEITATHYGGTKTLSIGAPLHDSVFKGLTALYRFRLGYETMEVDVSLQTVTGDADLFVKMNGEASRNSYDYMSSKIGVLADVITIPETSVCSECWVSVLVYGYQTSTFVLLVTLQDTVVQLTDSIPTPGSVAAGEVEFYSAVAPVAGIATAVLTVFSGRPLLFMSLTDEQPKAAGPDVVSDDSDSTGNLPSVQISVQSGQSIYVGVGGGDTNSSYTIRVAVDGQSVSPTAYPPVYRLVPGIPQSESIPANSASDWKYYYLNMPAGHETITIRGTRFVGEADFFVSRCPYTSVADCIPFLPNVTYHLYTTEELSEDLIDIRRADDISCTYLIGVHSLSWYLAYQVSATSEHTTMALQDGVTVTDHVDVGEIDYFSFYAPEDVSIRFLLTKVSGDPDIYISTNYSTPGPGAGHSIWKGTQWGSDTIVIDPSKDHRACSDCTYFIGIDGAYESTYRLTVSTASNLPVLSDGMPINDEVGMLTWRYYNFFYYFGAARDLKITLTTVVGDADLFVTLDGSKPTWLHHDYYSMAFSSSDEVRILHTDRQFTPCIRTATHQGCMVKIGVTGMRLNSQYSLVVTSSFTATLLSLGVASIGTVALGDYEYYRVVTNAGSTLASDQYSLTVSFSVFGGSLNAYLGCSLDTYPNSTTYLWKIEDPKKSVVIESMDLLDKRCTFVDSSVGASVFVAVFGKQQAEYSITAAMNTVSSMTMLLPGVTTSSVVDSKEFSYYLIRPGSKYQNLKLILTVQQGDADIYIGESWAARPVYSNSELAVTSFVKSSTSYGGDLLQLSNKWVSSLCSRVHAINECYFVVGVYGAYNAEATTSFSLVLSLEDSTMILTNGVPVRGLVGSREFDYYRYSLGTPNVDLNFILTPFSGDADLYISMAPVYHPYQYNYTWVAAAYGDDAVTIQAQSYSKHCTPNPEQGVMCDFFVGVYGYQNASYSLTVMMDTGFQNPITLIDGQPQSGSVSAGDYTYYRYAVSGGDLSAGLPTAITITLTPTDGNDVDMFLTFSGEPGRDNYDYASMSWGNNVDQIRIEPGMKHFCFSCSVNIAVWGFHAGHYTITAVSQGISQLQMGVAVGGHSNTETIQYFTVHNADLFAVLSFTLTSISGDADLYISTFKESTDDSADMVLPTRDHFTWRAMYYGDDSLIIDYTDSNFCVNCLYIVGVYGYRNATFTLLVTEKADSVVRLVPNRPQVASLEDLGDIRYFSAQLSSSAADMTFSLTPLDTGYADMYVQQYNISYYEAQVIAGTLKLPDPHDRSTYTATTFYDESNMIFIPGPHDQRTVFVVAVFALSSVRFSIVATLSTFPITLQAGVPQNHFVGKDGTISFRYYPNSDENLLISLVARSGDPDLFVGSGSVAPYCSLQSGGYALCGNYTWASRMYSTDQIFISTDEPCLPMLPSTLVSSTCDPDTAYTSSSSVPVNIVVLGFRDTQFTLVVSPSGGLRRLLAGQPQLSLATLGVLCKERNSRGSCATSRTRVEKTALVATFSFFVAAPSLSSTSTGKIPTSIGDLLITVLPQCANESSTICYPGCSCNPLKVFVSSCAVSECSIQSRHPADLVDNSAIVSRVVEGVGATLSLSTSDGSNCDPLAVGEGCVYFIAVSADYKRDVAHQQALSQAPFTISARTPFDIALVPCGSAGSSPDGLRFEETDTAYSDQESVRNYEVCSTSAESTVVSLEQCTGSSSLYACANEDHCANVLPTATNWDYFSDGLMSCYRRWVSYGDASGWGKEVCTPLRSNVATVTLSPLSGNYFLAANGSGQYVLRVEDTKGGKRISPALVVVGGRGVGWQGRVDVIEVTGTTTKLSWTTAAVMLPGARLPSAATSMKYLVYAFDTVAFTKAYYNDGERPVLTTPCGLEAAIHASTNEEMSFIRKYSISLHASDQEAAVIQRELTHLFPSRLVNLTVVAVCDSECLRYVSRAQADSSNNGAISCAGPGSCHTQYLVYPSIQINVGADADSPTQDTTDNGALDWVLTVVYGSIGVVVMLVLVSIVMWMSYAKRQPGEEIEGIQLQDYSVTAQSSEHGSEAGSFRIVDEDDPPPRYVPPTAFAMATNSIKSLMTDSETVNSFVGNVGKSMSSAVHSAFGNKETGSARNTSQNQSGTITYSPLVIGNSNKVGTKSSFKGAKSPTQGPFGKFEDDDEEVSVDL